MQEVHEMLVLPMVAAFILFLLLTRTPRYRTTFYPFGASCLLKGEQSSDLQSFSAMDQ